MAFNALPQAGGIMDQDAFLLRGISLVAAAKEDKRKAEEKHEEAKRRVYGSSRIPRRH